MCVCEYVLLFFFKSKTKRELRTFTCFKEHQIFNVRLNAYRATNVSKIYDGDARGYIGWNERNICSQISLKFTARINTAMWLCTYARARSQINLRMWTGKESIRFYDPKLILLEDFGSCFSVFIDSSVVAADNSCSDENILEFFCNIIKGQHERMQLQHFYTNIVERKNQYDWEYGMEYIVLPRITNVNIFFSWQSWLLEFSNISVSFWNTDQHFSPQHFFGVFPFSKLKFDIIEDMLTPSVFTGQ